VSMGKLHGVHAPHKKNTADSVPTRIPVPAVITVPVSMHIGAPATPVVKATDLVKVGQLLAEANGFVSSPIYSGVSGKVKKLEEVISSDGKFVTNIVIESDGNQEVYEGITPPTVTDKKSFIEAVRRSGVVGLGGAGFPTAVKLDVDPERIEAVIINGAECEPFITSDTRTMIDDAELVIEGIKLLEKFLGVKRTIIGVEDNKPEAIAKLESLCTNEPGIEVAAVPALYPQGGEKVLIYNTTGKVVPEGKLPIDVGTIVVNCTTIACIATYVKTGMPLVEKLITIDGSAVANPQNIIAPIGTPMKDLFEYCGGFKEEPRKVIYGGPMMGIAVTDLDAPVLKNTNAVLAFNEKDSILPEPSNCIKCGRCVRSCPFSLAPAAIEEFYELKNPGALKALKVNLCMECGCCSFICPARRPLVQVNKLAKAEVYKFNAELAAAEEKKKAKEAEAAKEGEQNG